MTAVASPRGLMAGKADGRCRRSAEARDSTDGLPLTVRERTFALRPADGKVCPKTDLHADIKDGAQRRRKEPDSSARSQTAVLPMMPGIPKRRTPSYARHGTTLSLA